MKKAIKIFLTIIILIVAIPIFDLSKNVPALKLILLAGIVGGVIAIWKSTPEENEKDNHHLDKTN